MKRMLCLLVLVALLGGCANKITSRLDLKSAIQSQVAGLSQGSSGAKKAERQAVVDILDTRYQEVRANAAEVMTDLDKKANKFSRIDISVGIGGIAAGVAASALVVASPANAVWVAALSGGPRAQWATRPAWPRRACPGPRSPPPTRNTRTLSPTPP
jgi:hypothetical protein